MHVITPQKGVRVRVFPGASVASRYSLYKNALRASGARALNKRTRDYIRAEDKAVFIQDFCNVVTTRSDILLGKRVSLYLIARSSDNFPIFRLLQLLATTQRGKNKARE